MQIEDYTSKGYVRRWDIVDGRPRCLLNALTPDSPQVTDALERNAKIRSLVEDAARVELAQSVPKPTNGLPEYLSVEEDVDGQIVESLVSNPEYALAPREVNGSPNVAWEAYDAAADVIAQASADTLLYIRVKNGNVADSAELTALLDTAGSIDYSELVDAVEDSDDLQDAAPN